MKKAQKQQTKESKRDTVTSKAVKRAKSMSDEELQYAIKRLNMEKNYATVSKDLSDLSKKNPTLKQKVKESVSKTAKEQASKLGKQVLDNLTNQLAKQINSTINNELNKSKDTGTEKKKSK